MGVEIGDLFLSKGMVLEVMEKVFGHTHIRKLVEPVALDINNYALVNGKEGDLCYAAKALLKFKNREREIEGKELISPFTASEEAFLSSWSVSIRGLHCYTTVKVCYFLSELFLRRFCNTPKIVVLLNKPMDYIAPMSELDSI